MRALLDTNILVYALAALDGDLDSYKAASLSVFRSASSICVSAISWLEVHRHIRPIQRASLGKLERLSPSFQILDINGRMAVRASELLGIRAQAGDVCTICLSPLKATPCKRCKRLLSRPQRFADALIVATAECSAGIDVLYTFDAGVLDMGRLVSGVEICSPPVASNAPELGLS